MLMDLAVVVVVGALMVAHLVISHQMAAFMVVAVDLLETVSMVEMGEMALFVLFGAEEERFHLQMLAILHKIMNALVYLVAVVDAGRGNRQGCVQMCQVGMDR